MRRLIAMQRGEDGAVAVLVTLLLVVLMGFSAFAVDVAATYQEKRELQNGADAAVLSAAWDCAEGAACSPGNPTLVASVNDLASANANDAMSAAQIVDVDLAAQEITVETSTVSSAGGFLRHWFAWALDQPTSTVRARATARWGVAASLPTLPLTFSQCEYDAAYGGGQQIIYFHSAQNGSEDGDCPSSPANQDAPGGFGWLLTNGEPTCTTDVDTDDDAPGNTGNDVPGPTSKTGCTAGFWKDLLGQTVVLPLFDETQEEAVKGKGSNTTYSVSGFAAFTLTGYRLGAQPEFNSDYWSSAYPRPCDGNDRCVSGEFTSATTYAKRVDLGLNDTGVTGVVLIK